MLWRFIEANDGLPDDCIVTFANTGKEAEETLEFVRDCGKQWDVPIVWLEYQWAEATKDRFKVTAFYTAARDGEPFEEVIRVAGVLPNPVARFCSLEMKVKTIGRFLFSIGMVEKISHGEAFSIVGIRADEQRRAAKIEPHRSPLVSAGVTKEAVSIFWKHQPFDLKLPNHSGVTPHGNCDLCFLKSAGLIKSLVEEKPSRADWWAKMEREVAAAGQSGGVWRQDRPTYAQMQVIAREQGQLDLAGDETIPCFCGD